MTSKPLSKKQWQLYDNLVKSHNKQAAILDRIGTGIESGRVNGENFETLITKVFDWDTNGCGN
jgi:hypothetical protein